MKFISVTIIAFFICISLNAQQKWSLSSNAGIASGTEAVDGYYFSFNFGIPLFKAIELSPTFSNASMLPKQSIYRDWNITDGLTPKPVPIEGYGNEHESIESLSSLSLLLLFKPFELIRTDKLKQHELIFGTGISHNSYIIIKEAFQKTGNLYELNRLSLQSNRKVEPYYFKLCYNYLFAENLFLGITGGIIGYSGEAELLAGLQFGVKFN